MRSRSGLTLLSLVVILAAACSSAGQPAAKPTQGGSASWPTTIAGIAAYQGADRQQMLVYPNVKLNVFRPAGENAIATLLTEEARSKKYTADVIESPPGSALLTLRYNLKAAVPYFTPAAKSYPPDSQELVEDKHLDYWVYDRENFIGFGYNTNALPASAVPKTFKDLLSPSLKGKMTITNTSFTVFIDNILRNQGQAYAQQLAQQQDVRVQNISAKALFDLVASGEVAASPSLYNDHAVIEARAGAPVKWVPLEPATVLFGGLAFVDHAPHPHAAMLLLDFLLGADGQKIFSDNAYESPAKAADFKTWNATKGLSVDEYEKHYNEAQGFLNRYFIKSGN